MNSGQFTAQAWGRRSYGLNAGISELMWLADTVVTNSQPYGATLTVRLIGLVSRPSRRLHLKVRRALVHLQLVFCLTVRNNVITST